jgi:hypothetical protein
MVEEWLWSDGHIGWAFFVLVVYTIGMFLIADLAWRLLVVSTRWLAAALALIWLIGAAAIWLGWW